MNALLLNVFLALIWAAANGNFGPANLFFGYVLGFLIIYFSQRVSGPVPYAHRTWQVITFVGFFIVELFKANIRVAMDVIRSQYYIRPSVISIPLSAKTDLEITLLANLITLTPGSVSLDVSDDRSVLYLHHMYVDDPEALRHEIKAGFERRVLEVLR